MSFALDSQDVEVWHVRFGQLCEALTELSENGNRVIRTRKTGDHWEVVSVRPESPEQN